MDISILNSRLGDALGRPNGTDPRFAWKRSTDLHYYYRNGPSESWQRRTWADRIGPVWLLCIWRPPEVDLFGVPVEVTRDQWFNMFGFSRPYPAMGEYQPLTETALDLGREPTEEGTAFYIISLRNQIEQAERDKKAELAGRVSDTVAQCEKDAQAVVDDKENEFMNKVGEWEPLSWKLGEPRDPGDQDGPVGFQTGVGDSPLSGKVGA